MIRVNVSSGGIQSELKPDAGIPAQIWLTDDLKDLAHLWPRTDRLGEAQCHVFQCADILEVWCSTIGFARRTQPFFVAVVDEHENPLMLLALGLEHRNWLRVLTFLDAGVCDYAAPVVFPAARQWGAGTIELLWRRLKQVLPRFDMAIFEKMPDHVGDLPNPLMFLGTVQYPTSCHAISLSGTWNTFARHRLPRQQDSRRRRRQLSQLGKLTFEIAETLDQRTSALRELIQQKGSWYVETLGLNLFDRPGFRAYLYEATQRFPNSGPIHVSTLKLNGRIISAHWGYVFGSRFYQFLPSYHDDLRRYAPGRLLHEHLIEWSFAQGLAFFDFGIGDEEYKNEYCDLVIQLHRVAIPMTIKGNTYLFLVAVKEYLRKTKLWALLRRLLKRSTNPGHARSRLRNCSS